ncbi:MAG: hypothetical protein D6720_00695 [Gammaproteobacteria bacterium]|nr:MAG: hypothetical protein D6720_00695 [Gammaproteobacteria bacterium]
MDALTPEEARARLRALSQGRRVPRRDLSLEEAKARLRETDADLDIGPFLHFASEGRWREAGLSLALWAVSEDGRYFFSPLLLSALSLVDGVLQALRKRPQ